MWYNHRMNRLLPTHNPLSPPQRDPAAAGHPKNGFTLIELLIVIAIIGILAVLVLAAVGVSQDRASSGKVRSGMHQMRILVQQYYDANGSSYANLATCLATPNQTNCKETVLAESISTLKEDIETANGEEDSVSASSTIRNFCLSAPQAGSTTDYICADVSGTLSEGTPSGSVCIGDEPTCSF